MSNTKATAPAVDTKSATDLLIEMQLAEQIRKNTNPLAVTEQGPVSGEKTGDGVTIGERTVFANGAVLENLA